MADSILLEKTVDFMVLTDCEQGPPGPGGPPGPPGDAVVMAVGPTALSGHSVVALDADGNLVPASSLDIAHLNAVLGVVSSAYMPDAPAVVQTGYALEHLGWSWAPGPVLVGAAGQMVQTLPIGALFSQVVGQAISSTRVLIDVHPPLLL